MRKKKWIFESELLYGKLKSGYQIKEKLFSAKSPYQKIEIYDVHFFRKMLLLDGIVQATERDEFIYHEMMAHVPLFSHPSPNKILIIGGGDGGVLREALKHPVSQATLVEIDGKVIDVCKKLMPAINGGAFKDKRARVIIGDGISFIKQHKEEFDVIIVDSSDPIGPAVGLFSSDFYRNISQSLTRNGVAIFQSGSTFLQAGETERIFKKNKEVFPFVNVCVFANPTYWGGFFSLTFVSKHINHVKLRSAEIEKRYKKLNLKTKYYNPQIHLSSFVLPNYIRQYLEPDEKKYNK